MYDDGDIETLDMNNQQWRFLDNDNENDNNDNPNNDTENVALQSATVHHLPTLKSNEQEDLQSLINHFGNRPFII